MFCIVLGVCGWGGGGGEGANKKVPLQIKTSENFRPKLPAGERGGEGRDGDGYSLNQSQGISQYSLIIRCLKRFFGQLKKLLKE